MGRFPSTLSLHYYTMFLLRIRIIVGDAGFEPRTSGALSISHHISMYSISYSNINLYNTKFIFYPVSQHIQLKRE